MIKELDYKELKSFCTFRKDKDVNMNDIDKIDVNEILGQTVGAEALRFGLEVKAKGYNIYVSGLPGSGKTTFAQRFAALKAKDEPVPPDLCYVHNFAQPNEPLLLSFEAGRGKEFKADMEELVAILKQELTEAFSSPEHDEEKTRINKHFQAEKDELMEKLQDAAKEKGFGVRTANGGVYFMPIIDGKTISEEEFESLTEDERKSITEGSEDVQELAADTMKKLHNIDALIKTELEKAEYNIGLLTVGYYLTPVQAKYSENTEVSNYLTAVKEDILDNLGDFIADTEQNGDDAISAMMPWLAKNDIEDDLLRYGVNLIVDNSTLDGAPVIVNHAPSYVSLVGEVEYDSENGNFTTDFTKIKPGILHKANGGYLILQVSDLLATTFGWECIKRVLKTGELTIEPIKEYQLGGINVAGIKPQAAPINVKVILIGTNYYYELLKAYDDDFGKLFKMTAMFDYEMDNNADNLKGMLSFIKLFEEKHGILPLTADALGAVAEHSSRLAESKERLTTRFSQINDILCEADTWARLDKAESITSDYIKKAVKKRTDRVNLYSRKYYEMITDNEIMIDTTGSAVGQINGLCVMETGDVTFGMPTRITASTYMGKAGIVNIEKEAEMSGSIHDKGVQVIIGYLGRKYAQQFPLTLSCRICFEQSYNGVDGDSASSTELYAIISSLSNMPINQELAVTGSVNQMGQIQPIGGVTYKIEGFFEICKSRGLTGSQGVIIPVQNEKDLTLSDEVVEAVKAGKFHIYSITTIDDGIELLMGAKAGTQNKSGTYTRGSVHQKVYGKLESNYKKSTEE
jgi:lon-related putative ATP-dependent protease